MDIHTTNQGLNLLGKTTVENHEEDYEPHAKDKDANNGEEEEEES